VRAELAGWALGALVDAQSVRLVDADALHVTLAFLGWRELREAPAVADAALACARPVPALSTKGVAWLPPRRPGVLVVDLDDGDGALAAMQAAVTDALVRAVGFEPEARPFRPHVTVARLRRGTRRPAGDLPDAPALAFAGESATLYRSQLRREGARYEPLARVAL
jgi:2'-5' RNA ligase